MYENLATIYDQLFPFNHEAIKQFLKPYLKSSGTAIDLGSGTGRLTHLIAHVPMEVIGIDLSQSMVAYAKKKYPELQFLYEDMISYLKNNEHLYDLMTCFGNTLVHLKPHQLNLLFKYAFLRLKHQGHLVIQLLNYDRILRDKPSHLKKLIFGQNSLQRHYTYLNDTIVFETILTKGDQTFTLGNQTLFPHRSAWLIEQAKAIGFIVSAYGTTNYDQLSLETDYVYLVLTKE
jgi:glycine/sarcosine N-methyltransferase